MNIVHSEFFFSCQVVFACLDSGVLALIAEYIILKMSSNSIKIVSMNCHRLADPHNKKNVFHYLRKRSYLIYLLTDTHFDSKLENCIQAERGYQCYFVSYNSSYRDVALLFYNNLEFSVKKVHKDIAGNYIFATVKMMDRDFFIVSLYGPYCDDSEFYIELEEQINEVGFEKNYHWR